MDAQEYKTTNTRHLLQIATLNCCQSSQHAATLPSPNSMSIPPQYEQDSRANYFLVSLNLFVMLAGYFATDSDQGVLELYADQLVRRTDPQKRSLKQFFEDEFAKKSSK